MEAVPRRTRSILPFVALAAVAAALPLLALALRTHSGGSSPAAAPAGSGIAEPRLPPPGGVVLARESGSLAVALSARVEPDARDPGALRGDGPEPAHVPDRGRRGGGRDRRAPVGPREPLRGVDPVAPDTAPVADYDVDVGPRRAPRGQRTAIRDRDLPRP